MPSGITGASITTFTNGTTADGPSVSTNDQSLKTNGVDNNGGLITTDGAGGLTAVNLSSVAGQLRGVFLLSTPYLLLNNATINASATSSVVCTGVGTPLVPAAAVAVLLSGFFSVPAGGGFLKIYPFGFVETNTSNYPVVGAPPSNTAFCNTAIVPIGTGGKITFESAATGNNTAIFFSIFGYIY